MRPAQSWPAACAAAFAIAALATAASAQTSANASAPAAVTVGNALAIDHAGDLSFGQISILNPANPATVTVGTADSVTSISNAAEGAGATIASASFTVSGVGGSAYSVSFPQSSVQLGGAGGPTLDTLVSNPSGSAGVLSGVSTGIGTQTLKVGGTLHVPANTSSGAYSGSFQVSVAYN